jgi:hypothetical protein
MCTVIHCCVDSVGMLLRQSAGCVARSARFVHRTSCAHLTLAAASRCVSGRNAPFSTDSSGPVGYAAAPVDVLDSTPPSETSRSRWMVPQLADLRKPRPPLSVEYPEVAEEWHPTKNGAMTPDDVTIFSRQVVWWRCKADNSHVWAEPVRARLGRTWRNKLLKQLDVKKVEHGADQLNRSTVEDGSPGKRKYPGHYILEKTLYDTASLPAPLAELVEDVVKGDKHACYTRGWGIKVDHSGAADVAAAESGFGPIAQNWKEGGLAFGVAWMELRNFRQDRSPTPLERCQAKGWTTELIRTIYKPQPCPCCSASRSSFSYKHSLAAARPDLAVSLLL